jgi:aminoglycoside phosphotransferase (APT) family kinase protein
MTSDPNSLHSGTPAADCQIDAPLVRELLREQHPDLADLTIRKTASGWDNEMFRLGERLCVRLPRRAAAASLLLNEQKWLPQLAARLPLLVPAALRVGRPSESFRYGWSVIPWLEGIPADIEEPGEDQSVPLAEFLLALHRDAPADAPRNPVRGCPLAERISAVEPRLARLQSKAPLIIDAVRSAWQQALSAPPDERHRWIHGDLHPQNVLVVSGRLRAVIDWGDMAAGDPATDLASIWMLISGVASRQRAMDRYGSAFVHGWMRAKGWAVVFGALLLDAGFAGDPRFAATGERTLRRVAEGP